MRRVSRRRTPPLSFLDVPADTWYTEAIRWAASEGIVKGYSAEAFGPKDLVTREQLATILYRYAQFKEIGIELENEDPLAPFKDAASVSYWAVEAVTWMVDVGIINGVAEDTLSPRSDATRAQIATMLMRFCTRFEEYVELPRE